MSELGGGFDIYAHLRERPGAHMTCPLCNGVSGVDPHPELILVCKLCGAPRIPVPEGSTVPPLAVAALKKADAARKKRGFLRGLQIVGGVGAAFGLFVFLITWLVGSFFWALMPAALFVAPAILAILWARSGRAAASKEVRAQVDAAWVAAGTELVRSGKVKTAADLMKVMGLDAIKAQEVFTLLSVDAEIGAPNLRVDPGAGPIVSQVPVDPRFAALEARAAAEQQAEAEAAAALEDARAKGRSH